VTIQNVCSEHIIVTILKHRNINQRYINSQLKLYESFEKMMSRNQGTMTVSNSATRRFCGLTVRDYLSFIGSLFLPLMLGVFTVVITLHQQNATIQQRIEDRQLAREQREQDLNMSREQRQQDLAMFALQREQDLNISREQRRQDKEIADAKQKQENILAEKQRNLSDDQRAHELKITERQLHDALFIAYMSDISILLKENNGTLTANPTLAVIARAKTITAIRQLDVSLKTYIVQFLYEAKQLTSGANPLDLSDAELNEVDFTINNTFHRNLRNLSLAGAFLRNSTFSYRDLTNADFSDADLTNARFIGCVLDSADLSHTIIVKTDFSKARLIGARFDKTQARRTVFRNTIAINATFTEGDMELVDFFACDCKNVDFRNTRMQNSDFSTAQLHQTRFYNANLVRVNFFSAILQDSNLTAARLNGANLTKSKCKRATFTKTTLVAAHFVQASLIDVDFTSLEMSDVDFSGADLTLATLSHTNLHNAKFNGTITILTNFSFASMKKVCISDEQLNNALSVRGATLPNGTIISHNPNLLPDGHAKCNYTLWRQNWQILPSDAIVILAKNNSADDCVSVNRINNIAHMSQRVTLKIYESLTIQNRVIYIVKVHGGGNISLLRINDHKDGLLAAVNLTQHKIKFYFEYICNLLFFQELMK
jgi:uncharacterized protein YjbI with pentapeptide repeats